MKAATTSSARMFLALAAASLSWSANAQLSTPTHVDTIKINRAVGGNCISAYQPSSSASDVSLEFCHSALDSIQKWALYGVRKNWRGYWDIYILRNESQGKCLGVQNNSTADGALLAMKTCTPATASWDPNLAQNANILWLREDAADNDGWNVTSKTKWRNVLSSKCIDSAYGFEGEEIKQWKCAGGSWDTQDFYGFR